MNLEDFRYKMESYRRDADVEAKSFKDPWIALDRLRNLYASFDEDELRMADQTIRAWLLSDDENLRFDAIALIRDFNIATALPDLHTLATRLALSTTAGAPSELRKVNRLIEELKERP